MSNHNFINLVFIYRNVDLCVASTRNSDHDRTILEKDVTDFVLERFSQVKKQNATNQLVKFHTINKYLLMAHSQKYLKILGNVVANHENKSIDEILVDYEKDLIPALNSAPTIKSHIKEYFFPDDTCLSNTNIDPFLD